MSDSDRLYIAQRMSALLQRELGEGIDAKRMVAQPLYARDVLLVCQALRETSLPALAEEFMASREDLGSPPPDSEALPGAAAGTGNAPPGVPAADSRSSEPPESRPPAGWRPSLWPATMRASLFGGLAKPKRVKAAAKKGQDPSGS